MGAHARGITKSMMLVTLVSKRMTTVLRLTTNFERSHVSDDVSEWRPLERIDRLRSGSNKARFDYCVNCQCEIPYVRDPKLQCTDTQRGWHACFFTAVDPLLEPSEVPSNHSDQPRMVPWRTIWKRHQDAVYWFDLKLAQEQRMGIMANNFQCHHTKRLGASG